MPFMRLFALSSLLIIGMLAGAAGAQDVRADFLRLIDRPRVPPDVQIADLATTRPVAGVHEYAISFAAEAGSRVPAILVENESPAGPRPVVIALHGTGGNKMDMLPLLEKLAQHGFIGVAIDGPYHGARSKTGKGSADYQDAILRAWHDQHEHPFFYDTVWDVMRLIDYLQSRPDVNPSRIGLYGVSKGGIETYLTAAVDRRVTCCVPCIGLESFKWAEDNDSWHSRIGTIQNAFDAAAKESGVASPGADFVHQFYSRVAPGIDGEFDGPSMAPLIAPRPMMTINGDSDPRTPLPGLKLCTDAAGAAYHAAGKDDRFLIRIREKTGHKVNLDSQAAAIDWFTKWLNPPAN
jgi:dienelactone hydrolase